MAVQGMQWHSLLHPPGVVNVKLSESLFPNMSVTVMAAVCSPDEKSSTLMSPINRPIDKKSYSSTFFNFFNVHSTSQLNL